jgi:hypothetical protein
VAGVEVTTLGNEPITRNPAKVSQMTPAEYVTWSRENGREKEKGKQLAKLHKADIEDLIREELDTTRVNAEADLGFLGPQYPLSAEAVETYKIKLPDGYVREGDLFVYRPTEVPLPDENQNQQASPLPAEQGQPVEGSPEGEAPQGAALGQGQGAAPVEAVAPNFDDVFDTPSEVAVKETVANGPAYVIDHPQSMEMIATEAGINLDGMDAVEAAQVATVASAPTATAGLEQQRQPVPYKGKVKTEYEAGVENGSSENASVEGVTPNMFDSMILGNIRKANQASKGIGQVTKDYTIPAYWHGWTQGRVDKKAPVGVESVDRYGVVLPEGYVKQGDLYVYRPQGPEQQGQPAPRTTVVSELEQYGFNPNNVTGFLQSVASKSKKPHERQIASLLVKHFGDMLARIPVTLSNLPDENFAGMYLPKSGQVVINSRRVGPRGAVDTVLHELLHAATVESIKNPTAAQQKILNRLERVRQSVQRRALKDDKLANLRYGTSSIDEFVTHFWTDPDFRKAVGELTPKGEKNWLRVIMDTIRDLLNGRVRTESERISAEVVADMTSLLETAAARPWGPSKSDVYLAMPGQATDTARFIELTEDLYRDSDEATAEQIAAWREANPGKWEELSAMREKVLTDAGMRIVFHGTNAPEFNKFDRTKTGTKTDDPLQGMAIWLVDQEDVAASHGERVMKLAVDLKKRTIVDMEGAYHEDVKGKMKKVLRRAMKDGDDGVIFENLEDPGIADWDARYPADIVAVFNPAQIKSADPISPGPRILPDEWADTGSPDIRYQPSDTDASDNDATYLAAVEAGDMETAQRMVDEAARAAGYSIGPVWHGTNREFTEFSKNAKQRTDEGVFGKGFYFGSERYASQFGPPKMFYLKLQNPATSQQVETIRKTGVGVRGEALQKRLRRAGFDGVIAESETYDTEMVAYDPSQIKSADPVTYDDQGNVIPLSQRFQTVSPDIRFQPSGETQQTPLQSDPVQSIRNTLTGFLPDGMTPDEFDIDLISQQVDDIDPVNAEAVIRAHVNHAVAVKAAEDALGDSVDADEKARLKDLFTRITTGNTTDADIVFHRSNPDALQRLMRYLAAAFKSLVERVKLGMGDKRTAVMIDRIGREYHRAKTGWQSEPTTRVFDENEPREKPSTTVSETGPLNPIRAVHFSREPLSITDQIDQDDRDNVFGNGFYAMEPQDEEMWTNMGRWEPGEFRNDVIIDAKNPLIITPDSYLELYVEAEKQKKERGYARTAVNYTIQQRMESGGHDAIIIRGFDWRQTQALQLEVEDRISEEFVPQFEAGRTEGRFVNGEERNAVGERISQEVAGMPLEALFSLSDVQNQIFVPPRNALSVVKTTPPDIRFQPSTTVSETIEEYSPQNWINAQEGNIAHRANQGGDLKGVSGFLKRMFIRQTDMSLASENVRRSYKYLENAQKELGRLVAVDYDKAIKGTVVTDEVRDNLNRAIGTTEPQLTRSDTQRINEEVKRRQVVLAETEDAERKEAQRVARNAIAAAKRQVQSDLRLAEEIEEEGRLKTQARKAAISDYEKAYKRIRETRQKAYDQAKEKRASGENTVMDFQRDMENRAMEANMREFARQRDLSQQWLDTNAPKVGTWVRRFRSQRLALQKEFIKLYPASEAPDFHAKLTRSEDLYLVRSYAIHHNPALAQQMLNDPKFEQIRQSAIETFRKSFAEQEIELMRNLNKYQGLTDEQLAAAQEQFSIGREVARLQRKAGPEADPEELMSIAKVNVAERARLAFEDFIMGHDIQDTVESATHGLRLPIDRLRQKKDIDPAIREALQEVTDPLFNSLRTLEALSKLITSNRQTAELAAIGTAEGWLITKAQKDANRNLYDKWVPIVSANPEHRSYPHLAGLYTSPEGKKAFDSAYGTGGRSSTNTSQAVLTGLNNRLRNLAGVSMGVVTLGNLAYFTRGFAGSHITAIAVGAIPFASGGAYKKGYRMSLFSSVLGEDTRWFDTFVKDPETFRNQMLELVSSGVLKDSNQVSYLNELIEAGSKTPSQAVALAEKYVNKASIDALGTIKGKASKALEFLTKMADFTEGVVSPIVYYYWKDLLTKAKFGTEEEIKQEAARRTKRVTPTHSMRSQAVETFSQNGISALIAPFIGFKSEMIRSTFEIYRLIQEDYKSGNDVLRRSAHQRAAIAATVHGGLTMIAPLALAASAGIGDDEDEAIRAALPSYSQNSSFIPLINRDDKTITLIDLTFANPYSFPIDPFTSTMRNLLNGKPEDIPNTWYRFLADGMFGEQVAVSKLIDVKRNINETTGLPIYLESDTDAEKLRKSLMHVVAGAYTPATIKKLADLKDSLNDGDTGRDNWWYSPAGITFSMVAIFRPRNYRIEDMRFRAFNNQRKANSELWQITSSLKSPAPLDASVEDIYADRVDATRRVWQKIDRLASGFEGLGSDKNEIARSMVDTGLSRRRTTLVLNGHVTDLPVMGEEERQDIYRISPERLRQLDAAYRMHPRYLQLRD